MTKNGGSLDTDLIRELAALLDETSLTEIEIGTEAARVRGRRRPSRCGDLAHGGNRVSLSGAGSGAVH
jgi:hypothetical protein